MEEMEIGSITVRMEDISLDDKPKSFKLNGVEYFFDHTRKPKLDPIEQIVDINKLKDTGCNKKQGLCNNLECKTCYEKSFLNHTKCIYYSNKNEVHPRYISMGMHKKITMNCNKCNHSFDMAPCDIKKGNWCPYCSIPSKKLCNSISCYHCYSRSFSSSEKSKYWSSKNLQSPRDTFKNSSTKFILFCNVCNHEFERKLDILYSCPYCSHMELCRDNNCHSCFNKSLASSECSNFWCSENKITPREVFKYTDTRKYKFKCPTCDHIIEIHPINASKKFQCTYCSSKLLCEIQSCMTCFNKSLSSCPDVKYFSVKNNASPRMVFKGGDTFKYMFNCNDCNNEYQTTAYHFALRHQRCNCLINKTEAVLFEYLSVTYSVEKQQRFEWCFNMDTGLICPFDFYLPDLNLLIELDGRQHFKQVSTWKSPEDNRKSDVYKMIKVFQQNLSLIRFYQEDVWEDKNNWKERLIPYLIKYESPKIIFIDNNKNLYNQHIEDLIKSIPKENIIHTKIE